MVALILRPRRISQSTARHQKLTTISLISSKRRRISRQLHRSLSQRPHCHCWINRLQRSSDKISPLRYRNIPTAVEQREASVDEEVSERAEETLAHSAAYPKVQVRVE